MKKEINIKHFKYLLWTCMFIFTGILIFTFLGEKTVNNGAGYDGLFYRGVAKNFPELLSASFSNYKATRILPFAICYYILRVLHIEATDAAVLNIVWIFIFLLLLMAMYYYNRLCVICNWSPAVKVTGFILLFFHFAITKYPGYYPLLTDHFIFSLSVISVYYFKKNNTIALIILGILSSFIWASSLLIYSLFILNNKIKDDTEFIPAQLQKKIFFLVKVGFSFLPIFIFVFLIRRYNLWVNKAFLNADWIYANFKPYNFTVALIALAATGIYYYLIIKPVNLQFIARFLKSILNTRISQVISVVILCTVVVTIKYFLTRGNKEFPYPTLEDLVKEFVFRPAVSPFNFIVYHFWFLGFIVLFILQDYKNIFREFSGIGNGYLLIMFYALIFVTAAQSRILINMVPVFILPILNLLNKRNNLNVPQLILFAVLALLVSRFWFPIELNGHYMKEGDTSIEKYPMFIGPWISDQFYIILGLLGIVFYFIWRQFIWKPISKLNTAHTI